MQAIHKQFIKQWLDFHGVHHVGGFIDTELLGNDLQLLLQHFADTVFHGVFQHEVDGTHHMGLANAVDAADSLLQAHRVPGHIEVDDHMAELQVQALTAGVGRDQHPYIAGECLLGAGARLQIHAAVKQDNGKPAAFQKLGQHRLSRHKLGEHQYLQFWGVLFLLQLVDQLQQRFGLGIGALPFGFPGQIKQHLDFGFLLLPVAGLQGHVEL